MAAEGDHYKLAFNSPGTWSQKYNLVWDRILDYNLFPEKVRDTDFAYYLTKINKYGLPLDSRADYTKLDWSIWTATLTPDRKQFDAIMDPIYLWMNEGPTRVPLTDWYDTKDGKQIGFQARSVVRRRPDQSPCGQAPYEQVPTSWQTATSPAWKR